ncbi:hypothetical protein J1N35_041134 [Gossypium stocksii]|uniref:Uncharacterized protein n=1 Tax=Gossypium stocksii TaxID=47602 RepID=A0A9D3UF63_9ROSI|nr:hypothetical protein J1N35_041134 [Gossypium stocksii]
MFKSNMPRKRTRASAQIDKTQNKFHCEEAKVRYEIHEFYVNLTSSELTEVPVREIKAPITSNAINEFFELPDFENDEYSSLISNIKPKNLQEILEEFTVPGSKWTVSKQGILTCRREYLSPLAKIEPEQSTEILDEARPIEPEAEPDTETSMFRAPPPSPDLRDELSKLMDIMQHMQWH